MGLELASESKIVEYYESERASQSDFKLLGKGLHHYITTKKKREEQGDNDLSSALKIGKAVDDALTGESGALQNKYYVMPEGENPSDNIATIVKKVVERLEESIILSVISEEGKNLEGYGDLIIQYAADVDYGGRWKDETVIQKVVEGGQGLFTALIESSGKTILTQEEYNTVSAIVMSLATNPKTARYFDRDAIVADSNITVYYQFPIYFDFNGVECKSLLDIVVVFENTEGKVSYQPIDLKTMHGETVDFVRAMKQFGYHIQGAFYTEALKEFVKREHTESDSVIEPFLFIVESTTNPGTPLIWEMTEEVLLIGKYGLPALVQQITVPEATEPVNLPIRYEEKGFVSLLEEYKWYQENGFEVDRLIVENGDNFIPLKWIK